MKKKMAWLMAVVLLVGCITSCGGNATETGTGGGTETLSGNADARGLVRTTFTLMPKFDPATGSDVAASASILNLYDSLVYPTADGNVEPNIATEWTTSEDGLVWDFKIRDDVTFHSGNPLTAEDVAYSMNRLLTIGQGYSFLFTGIVEKAEAVDSTTFRITCSKTYGPLLSALVRLYIVDSKLLAENYESGSYGEYGDYGMNYLLSHDAGSGAYYLTDVQQDISISGERFEDYWKGYDPDSPEGFIFYATNEGVTVKAMMSRQELEISDQWQSAENIAEIAAMDGIEMVTNTTGQMLSLWVNNQKRPTDDPHFRKALGYLMDYASLCEVVLPGSIQNNSVISPVLLGSMDMYDFSYNLDKAKEELALSKYADSYQNEEIEIVWGSATPDREKVALMFQAAAQQVGLNVKVVQHPWSTIVELASSVESSPNITVLSLTPQCSDAGIQLNTLLHSGTPTWEKMSWVQNDEVDAAIDEALAIIDTEERVAAYEAIQEDLKDICPMIPLVQSPELLCYQASYMEFNPTIPLQGYSFVLRDMRVYPEKRAN